jgi:dihydrofolate reductase
MINLIWAMDQNWLVGDSDKLPWRYKEDLLYFKEKTHNKTVLMGEKTYRSLKDVYYKNKKVPYGKIYVASLNDDLYDDAIKVNDVEEFLKGVKEELWVIGGATIYNLAIPFADKLYITWILKEYKGDIYFPKFDINKDFQLLEEKEGLNKDLKFTVYGRVK